VHRSFVSLALLALTFPLEAGPASAAWTRDPSVNLPICIAANAQTKPALASDGTGGAFIAWVDGRNADDDIYVQHVDVHGVPLWTANGSPASGPGAHESNPLVVSDGTGGAILAWYRQSFYRNVFVGRVNAAGILQWTTQITSNYNQDHLALASDGFGGAVVLWQDARVGGNGYDIYAQRVNPSGAAQWGVGGVAVCMAANNQNNPKAVPDGTGGAIIVWGDERRYIFSDIYAQRMNGAGMPQWTVDGIALAPVSYYRENPAIVADGAGGVVIAWQDERNTGLDDIYVQRLNVSGVAQWTANGVQLGGAGNDDRQSLPGLVSDGTGGAVVAWQGGDGTNPGTGWNVYARRITAVGVPQGSAQVALCSVGGDQTGVGIATDGFGGAIVTWNDGRSFPQDVYASRLNSAGAAEWIANGALVSSAPGDQTFPVIASDGRAGAILAWQDYRSGTIDIYVQRIEAFGFLGNPEPEVTWVRDVPSDQGERVRIRWSRSYPDTIPALAVSSYGIWRRVTETAGAAAVARGACLSREHATLAPEPGVFRVESASAQTTWWEGVGSVPARGEPWYTYVAETFQDSTAAGNPLTVFMVDAHHLYGPAFWSSVPDSGYSVDNLPPAVPSAFAGYYQAGATQLTWNPNVENDLALYYLYRGTSAGFVPSAANRIGSPSAPGYTDPGPAGNFYKLSAVDIHGNESGFAALTGTTGVAGGLPRELALARPSPNPAKSDVALRFALPRESRVSLTIHDAQGRLVKRLIAGIQPAGEHVARWDLRDDRGSSVGGGLYWVRLDFEGRSLTARLVALR